MSYSEAESLVLARFAEKSRIAGGPKAGYNLRKASIEYGGDARHRAAATEGLLSLVEKALLVSNESGDRYILTTEGAEVLAGSADT